MCTINARHPIKCIFINNLWNFCGGDEVPRTIIYVNTIKSYLIGKNSIFCTLDILLDLFRHAVICYFVVGSVVGRIDRHGFSEISTKCRDGK